MKRLCTICARGGSKGVPGKNVKIIAGKPLIAHTIIHAIESKLFDYIAVSSDSDEILEVAHSFNVNFTFKRPEYLATDSAAKIPVINHCAQQVEKETNIKFDTFVDLDCTSPLRNTSDIIGTVNMLETGDYSNIITGAPARRSPYFNLVEEHAGKYVCLSKDINKIVRRQDSPKCYDMNASIYAWKREFFFTNEKVILEKTGIFIMPEERSLDIDSPLDFKLVTYLLENKNEQE